MKRQLNIITHGVEDTKSHDFTTGLVIVSDNDSNNNFEIAIDCHKKSGNKTSQRTYSKITIVFGNGESWTGTIFDLQNQLDGVSSKLIAPHRTSLNEA